MRIIGLTGSIGMGKSTVAAHIRSRGVAVFDADAAVHALYAGGEAAMAVNAAFPGVLTAGGAVDRAVLAQKLGGEARAFARLEAIVHPRVQASERAFIRDAHGRGDQLVVLEIPLLFEGNRALAMDAVMVVSAPAEVQRARVLARPGMTPERLANLLARQLSDAEKRRRADYVIDTGGSLEETLRQTDATLAAAALLACRAIGHYGV